MFYLSQVEFEMHTCSSITQVFRTDRINLSPFTKDFRVWGTIIENSSTLFQAFWKEGLLSNLLTYEKHILSSDMNVDFPPCFSGSAPSFVHTMCPTTLAWMFTTPHLCPETFPWPLVWSSLWNLGYTFPRGGRYVIWTAKPRLWKTSWESVFDSRMTYS